MKYSLKWGHIFSVQGTGDSPRLRLLRQLKNRQESCSLPSMREATEADNSVFVAVREALALVNSTNKPFSVVVASERAS